MRRIIFDPEAAADLENQIQYLIDNNAVAAAGTLEVRVRTFISRHLAVFPASGRSVAHRNLWEAFIPQTRLLLWYRYTDDELQIVRVWHTSQNRSPNL